MRIALVGHSGYWGQKLARVVQDLKLEVVAQIDRNNIAKLDDVEADACIIATPPDTHFDIAMKAMNLGMDVLVEKPMATKEIHAIDMADFARENGIVLSVDSTFLHTRAFEWLQDQEEPVISYQSIRLAPPMPQAVIPAGWDLIVHDLSILHRLDAIDFDILGFGVQDGAVAQAALALMSGGSAFILASRAWPKKERQVAIHMPSGKYHWTLDGLFTFEGKSIVKEIEEPLKRMLLDFVRRCANNDVEGLTDGLHGADVVGCLDRLFPRGEDCFLGSRKMGNGNYGVSAF